MHNDTIIKLFRRPKTDREMQLLLEILLSPQEIQTLAKRQEILRLLKQQIPHHEIAQQLGVGVATVTRGSKMMQNPNYQPLSSWWG